MSGIALLLLMGGYIWAAKKVVDAAWNHSGWLAAACLAIFVVAPLADAIGGRFVLQSRCEREGKGVVVQRIPDVEVIRVQRDVYDSDPQYYGYKYVESSGGGFGDWMSNQLVNRAVRNIAGRKSTIERGVAPIAKYALVTGNRTRSSYYFNSIHVAVVELATRREVAHFEQVEFLGGWAERFASMFSDAGPGIAANCGDQGAATITMLHSALAPAPG